MVRFVLVMGFVVSLLIGISVGIWGVPYVLPPQAQSDPIEQYYRGVYDMCRVAVHMAGGSTKQCTDDVVPQLLRRDWYGQASTDWTWPLTETTILER